MARPCSSASRAAANIDAGSPPWKPQARLTEVADGNVPASSPIFQAPYDSPASMLMSIAVMAPAMVRARGAVPRFEIRGVRVSSENALLLCGYERRLSAP